MVRKRLWVRFPSSALKVDFKSKNMLIDYFKEVKVELRKVSWPSREQTKKYTIMVIVVSFIVGLYLTGLDYVLSKVVGGIVGR